MCSDITLSITPSSYPDLSEGNCCGPLGISKTRHDLYCSAAIAVIGLLAAFATLGAGAYNRGIAVCGCLVGLVANGCLVAALCTFVCFEQENDNAKKDSECILKLIKGVY